MADNPKQNKKEPEEKYIKVPMHVLHNEKIGQAEKLLYSYIYGFGVKGCYYSNLQLAKEFNCCERTIKNWLHNIISANLVYIKSGKGYYRTFYAKTNPDVLKANKLWYRKREISKLDLIWPEPGNILPLIGQSLSPNQAISCPPTGQKPVLPLGNILPTINKRLEIDKKEITAQPTPLPALGQASAEQKNYRQDLKTRLGIGVKTEKKVMSELDKVKADEELKTIGIKMKSG